MALAIDENIAYILLLILQKGGRNSTEMVGVFTVIEKYIRTKVESRYQTNVSKQYIRSS